MLQDFNNNNNMQQQSYNTFMANIFTEHLFIKG